MFYYISGAIAALEHNFAVIDASGVGYKMTVSYNTYATLSATASQTAKLYSYMAIREDEVELFGFYSPEELSAFKMLITVSGVGPKAAISILSQLTPSKLAVAVCTEDKKSISQANGIGPKTAARIILELKDKLKNDFVEEEATSVSMTSAVSGSSSKLSDAQDALMVLGYSRSEALGALKGIDTESVSLDDIIKSALKKLMR